MSVKEKLSEPVVNRNGWQIIGTSLAMLAAFATMHALIVVPSILYAAGELMDEKLQTHARGIHEDAVSSREVDRLHKQMMRIERKLDLMQSRIAEARREP